ncbi:MAG: hypothetical protein MKZ95_11830 [Pirellulales bacterium]|nr:hypothetical protein [Pirellulales bacterium]
MGRYRSNARWACPPSEAAFAAAHFAADFDFDGDVDRSDLTNATSGWYFRYADDLQGSDFLSWQQQLEISVFPQVAAVVVVLEPGTFACSILCTLDLVSIRFEKSCYNAGQ